MSLVVSLITTSRSNCIVGVQVLHGNGGHQPDGKGCGVGFF